MHSETLLVACVSVYWVMKDLREETNAGGVWLGLSVFFMSR